MILVLLTILAISALLPPLGCIMLWYRYNYFSDGLVHSCLFSGIISYFLNIPQILSMMFVAIIFSSLVFILKFHSNRNAITSVVSSAFLASSIILASKLQEKIILESMLFGDIFTIQQSGFYLILCMLAITALFIGICFNKIVIMSIDPDIAKISNIPVHLIEFLILLILSLVIAISIKFTGAFLIGSFLIIPATAARLITKSPLQMILLSVIIGGTSGITGFYLSLTYDLPLSPSIGSISIGIYFILNIFRRYLI